MERIKDCYIKVVTPKGGTLIVLPTGKEVWIPTSAIHDDSEIWKKGEKGTLTVTAWVAESKGLIA